MVTKTFELRDRATFVPVLAVKLSPGSVADQYLLRRAGYGTDDDYILMMGLDGGCDKATSDPYDWGSNRTRLICHDFIIKHWDELESGQVLDAEFIAGETDKPKVSERFA